MRVRRGELHESAAVPPTIRVLVKSPLPENLGPTFEPGVHLCRQHLEPFRAGWDERPTHWVLLMIGLFWECTCRQDFWDMCGGSPEMFQRVLLELSPVCCWLGDDITKKWTDIAFSDDKDAHKAERDRLFALTAEGGLFK